MAIIEKIKSNPRLKHLVLWMLMPKNQGQTKALGAMVRESLKTPQRKRLADKAPNTY